MSPPSQKNSCLCLYTVLGSIQWAHGAPEDPSLRIFPLKTQSQHFIGTSRMTFYVRVRYIQICIIVGY